MAYRWGILNEHQYIVGVETDLEEAKKLADDEVSHRGGKYSCAVQDATSNVHYYARCLTDEKTATKPEVSRALEAYRRIGFTVAHAGDPQCGPMSYSLDSISKVLRGYEEVIYEQGDLRPWVKGTTPKVESSIITPNTPSIETPQSVTSSPNIVMGSPILPGQ